MKHITIALLLIFLSIGAGPVETKPISSHSNAVRGDEINPAQREAVRKGLEWLANQQGDDGGYGENPYSNGSSHHVGITALAGLAFMQGGNLPGRGKYGNEVQGCLNFILNNCEESGLIVSDESHGTMYGHGFATLMLGEVYGMTGDEQVKERLTKAVKLIERTQNDEGGWRYNAIREDSDISVTVCQIMAIRSARDAGVKVEKDVIDKAIKYVRQCQNDDGGFCYQIFQHGTGSGAARTGAGLTALFHCGISQGKEIDNGMKYLMSFKPFGKDPSNDSMYNYTNYYVSQVMFLYGGDAWKKYYPYIRDEIIAKQDTDGHWAGEAGDHYSTSMSLLVLQLPNRLIPIYSGKGNGN